MNLEPENKVCQHCKKVLRGRIDKKFCDDYCRNTYNNSKNSDANNFVRNINNILRKNRRILSTFLQNEEPHKKVSLDLLISNGFQFKYFTHQLFNHKKQQYFFVYEYGYLDLGDSNYLIVKSNRSD